MSTDGWHSESAGGSDCIRRWPKPSITSFNAAISTAPWDRWRHCWSSFNGPGAGAPASTCCRFCWPCSPSRLPRSSPPAAALCVLFRGPGETALADCSSGLPACFGVDGISTGGGGRHDAAYLHVFHDSRGGLPADATFCVASLRRNAACPAASECGYRPRSSYGMECACRSGVPVRARAAGAGGLHRGPAPTQTVSHRVRRFVVHRYAIAHLALYPGRGGERPPHVLFISRIDAGRGVDSLPGLPTPGRIGLPSRAAPRVAKASGRGPCGWRFVRVRVRRAPPQRGVAHGRVAVGRRCPKVPAQRARTDDLRGDQNGRGRSCGRADPVRTRLGYILPTMRRSRRISAL